MSKKQKTITDFTALGTIGAEIVLKNLPFVLFVSFLALIYIANAHYSEKKVREIQALQKDVKELRWQFMSLKSDLMYNSKQSEVMRRVEEQGLKISEKKPKKIIVPKRE